MKTRYIWQKLKFIGIEKEKYPEATVHVERMLNTDMEGKKTVLGELDDEMLETMFELIKGSLPSYYGRNEDIQGISKEHADRCCRC